MRLDKWFISNLDDAQRAVIVRDPNESLIVQGAAGSGKTNLAIHRAMQASAFGSYAIIIYTIALKRMIAYGMDVLGLDKERIAYDWQFNNRGFDFDGFVYCRKEYLEYTDESKPRPWHIDSEYLYLVQDEKIRKFKRVTEFDPERKDKQVSIDFGDWVDDCFYYAFRRRTRWFEEVELTENFDVNSEDYILIPSGTLFKKPEDYIDYIIVDEVQDFNISEIKDQFLAKAKKSLTLFGDSAQKIYKNKGASIDDIYKELRYRRFILINNYRLPISIAKMAQDIPEPSVDLLSNNKKDNGNSDFPRYPKPVITKYNSYNEELQGIINRIRSEDLDDVAILVPKEDDVKDVHKFFKDNKIQTQVHYRTGKTVPYNTVNTLDFSNNDLPCILTYHAAKGTEFDNVFIPFACYDNLPDRSAFYVACTRSSSRLFISYHGIMTNYLDRINSDYIENGK